LASSLFARIGDGGEVVGDDEEAVEDDIGSGAGLSSEWIEDLAGS